MWLEDKHFREPIKTQWNGFDVSSQASYRLSSKLKRLKFSIKDWIKTNLRSVDSYKATLLKEMQALDLKEENQILSDMDIAKRFNLKDLFERRVCEEEIKWKQRSRCRWLKEGDRNTKFFNSMATVRIRGNKINFLSVNGNRLEDREGITNHIIDYFQNIYSKNSRVKPSVDNLQLSTITREAAISLEGEFLEEEVRSALFNLASNKAPGPDGFPISFFQKHWDLLKANIMAFMT